MAGLGQADHFEDCLLIIGQVRVASWFTSSNINMRDRCIVIEFVVVHVNWPNDLIV